MIILNNNKIFNEFKYTFESLIEKDVIDNYKLIFGQDTIFIQPKKKIDSKSIGSTIPDGYLFDLSDKNNPEFYVVEAELEKHDFYKHIFPQVTKFFAFFKNKKGQSDLIKKIYSEIDSSEELKNEFKKYLGHKEIYKFLNDTLDSSQNILIVIDGSKPELPEVIDTYTDTWGKVVKVMIVKKFINQGDVLFTVDPAFKDIEYANIEPIENEADSENEQDENYHLNGTNELVKQAYFRIKTALVAYDDTLIFRPKKYYIALTRSRNLTFIHLKKSKIRLIVMEAYESVTKKIIHHHINQLSESVQKFWNGPSCEIIIENDNNIDEVIDLLEKIVEKDKKGGKFKKELINPTMS